MDLQFEKKDLVRDLALAAGACDKRGSLPVLSAVRIVADQTIQLTGSDLDLTFMTPVSGRIVTAGSAVVPAKPLLDYVKALPEGEVKITTAENDWVKVRSGRAWARIPGMSIEQYPDIPVAPDEQMEVPLPLLAQMIRLVSFAISEEESKFIVEGALLKSAGGKLTLVATDGHRLALCARQSDCANVEILLPRRLLNEIVRLADASDDESVVSFSQDQNNLFFEAYGRQIVCRKLMGRFPDYERVLPKQPQNAVTLSRRDLHRSLSRVRQFADARSKAVRFLLSAEEIALRAETVETGEAEETLPAEVVGVPVETALNAAYLTEFLAVCATEKVIMRYAKPDVAFIFEPEQDGGFEYRYVLMPMRF